MAITYKWTINQMNAHIQAEGEDNVIFTVHWTYSGSEESGGQQYQASQIGAQSFTYVAGEPFVPYEDTEAPKPKPYEPLRQGSHQAAKPSTEVAKKQGFTL